MKIYCDSSLREACYVIEGEEPVVTPYPALVTVNVGEYLAVILALEEAGNRRLEEVEILTDSQLVVKQVNGVWRVTKRGKHLRPHMLKIRLLLDDVKGSINWVPREENVAGKVLEER